MAARIAVLGATGQAGRQICRLLLADPGIHVVACARHRDRLRALEASLSDVGTRLSTSVLNVHDTPYLDELLRKTDVVVGATSRWQDGPEIARRAVRSGTSYIGIYLSNPSKWSALRQLRKEAVARGVTLIDDGGAHPGLPGAMIRLYDARTTLASAWVGARFEITWSRLKLAPETIDDFVSEIEATDPQVYLERQWMKGYRHSRKFAFGSGRKLTSCLPMCIEEIRGIASSSPELRSTGFFIAGFGPFVDYGVFPFAIAIRKLSRRGAARILWWGLKRFDARRESAEIVLEAESVDGAEVDFRVSHPDAYLLTAAPAVVTVQQVLKTPKPGVWTQAEFVEPEPFFKDLAQLGIQLRERGQEIASGTPEPLGIAV